MYTMKIVKVVLVLSLVGFASQYLASKEEAKPVDNQQVTEYKETIADVQPTRENASKISFSYGFVSAINNSRYVRGLSVDEETLAKANDALKIVRRYIESAQDKEAAGKEMQETMLAGQKAGEEWFLNNGGENGN